MQWLLHGAMRESGLLSGLQKQRKIQILMNGIRKDGEQTRTGLLGTEEEMDKRALRAEHGSGMILL